MSTRSTARGALGDRRKLARTRRRWGKGRTIKTDRIREETLGRENGKIASLRRKREIGNVELAKGEASTIKTVASQVYQIYWREARAVSKMSSITKSKRGARLKGMRKNRLGNQNGEIKRKKTPLSDAIKLSDEIALTFNRRFFKI